MLSAFGIDHGISKSMITPGVFKPAKLLTAGERAATRNRSATRTGQFKTWGRPGPISERMYASSKGRKVAGHLAAADRNIPLGRHTEVNWHSPDSPRAAHKTTDNVLRNAGGRAIINGRGGGRVEMYGTPGGSTRGTKNSDILTHEMRHIGPKRNPIRFQERTQDPFRRGREEGRADFGIKRGEPYPGSPEFRRGYEDVQNRMTAAKQRRR